MALFEKFEKQIKLNFKKIVFGLTAFIIAVLDVNAASNPYNRDFNGKINCTWYAWQQAYDKAGVALPGWGNANTWLDFAKQAGYETGMTPRVNSIVLWQWNNFGHVGYVERVYGDYIYVWDSVHPDGCPAEQPDFYECLNHTDPALGEGDCGKYAYIPHGCTYHTTYWHNQGDLIGYIYLDNAPKNPVVNGTTNQDVGTSAPVEKSNNTNLSSIKVSDIDFEFTKDNLEYNLEVKNSIESINIEAKTEDDKATLEGTGEHKLNIGDNTIELVVNAEDGSKKTYTIKIKRKDNNTYLSSLTIQNIDFKFDKNIFAYEIEVAKDIESIMIDGVLESETSKVEGLGKYVLTEDETTIKIIITAEDETEKTYTIKIKKESKTVSDTVSNNKTNILIVVGSSIVVLVIFICAITYIVKRRKNDDKKDIDKKKKSNKNIK